VTGFPPREQNVDRRKQLRMIEHDRRHQPRTSLAVPVRVQGQYPDGEAWDETTTTSVASMGGAAFGLGHRVLLGQALHLSLPLPRRFRTFDLGAPTYRLYVVAASVSPAGGVGVRFLGKDPPDGYRRNSSGLFLAPPTAPSAPERRSAPRRDGLFLFVLKPRGNRDERQEEATVADNLGAGGTRIMTTQLFARGEVVDVEEAGGPFRTRAAVRNAYVGEDAVWRLNLMFLDEQAPDRLLSE
jgi:hypothetical protein